MFFLVSQANLSVYFLHCSVTLNARRGSICALYTDLQVVSLIGLGNEPRSPGPELTLYPLEYLSSFRQFDFAGAAVTPTLCVHVTRIGCRIIFFILYSGSVTLFIDCERVGTKKMRLKANEIGVGGRTYLGRTKRDTPSEVNVLRMQRFS